jgi:hypothetical protein
MRRTIACSSDGAMTAPSSCFDLTSFKPPARIHAAEDADAIINPSNEWTTY